ncbi:hypothetical protein V8C42DRAFT_337780 [Trichoderma barbatum]
MLSVKHCFIYCCHNQADMPNRETSQHENRQRHVNSPMTMNDVNDKFLLMKSKIRARAR